MIKFKVFKEKEKEEEPKEVYFKLKQRWNGVELVACDSNGKAFHCGNILEIKSNGTLYKYNGINKELGLSLYPNGEIKEEI